MVNKVESLLDLKNILDDFYKEVDWLHTFITDPTGSRYLKEKTQETRLQEYREQIMRMNDFLEFTGNPHKTFLPIHVAGTSGKGSVVVMIANILAQCQLHVGFHISPYLQICNEKLVIDGIMIAPSEFASLVRQFRQIHKNWEISRGRFSRLKYVEVWVALTYLWFAQNHVDWGVVETGMGGRFDPTNVLSSKLAVITNVGHDHIPMLGMNLSDIAYHKAGIIKQDGIAITAITDPEILPIIEEEAANKNAILYQFYKDFDFTMHEINAQGARISVETPFNRYNHIHIVTRGSFQPVNAALAIASVDILAQQHNIPLSKAALKTAMNTQFPGRLEIMQQDPTVVLDGAHNTHKMQALVNSMRAIYLGKKITLIIASLSTKDARSMLKLLLPIVSQVIVTKTNILGKPPLEPQILADIIQELEPKKQTHIIENVRESIDLALKKVNKDEMVLITGSLFLIGNAREYWVSSEELLGNLEAEKQSLNHC